MNERVSAGCDRGQGIGKAVRREQRAIYRWLLTCIVAAFTVGGSLPVMAINGELVEAAGLYRTGTCTKDFTISCDDRAANGVTSCHMRGAQGDEGLAVKACVDGGVTTAASPTLEEGVDINATDFGAFYCGVAGGKNFCIVCDTFTGLGLPPGNSQCVKITDDNSNTSGPGTCGAYTIARNAACTTQTQDLTKAFSAPRVGFTIGFNGSDASQSAQKVLTVCGKRKWECVDDRSSEFAIDTTLVQQQQTHALIDTPCCVRLASGSYYCSAKLTTSATCR